MPLGEDCDELGPGNILATSWGGIATRWEEMAKGGNGNELGGDCNEFRSWSFGSHVYPYHIGLHEALCQSLRAVFDSHIDCMKGEPGQDGIVVKTQVGIGAIGFALANGPLGKTLVLVRFVLFVKTWPHIRHMLVSRLHHDVHAA